MEKIEKNFCIFIANVFDDKIWQDIQGVRKYTQSEFNLEIKTQFKKKEINQEINNNGINTDSAKLNELGVPTNIKTGYSIDNNNYDVNKNFIENITDEFNNKLKDRCQKKFFITEEHIFQNLLDEFDKTINNDIEFPKFDNFYVLEIIIACSLKTTEEYIKKNSDNIYQEIFKNLSKK